MEIYDTANRLAEEIKNSKQYKELKSAKEKLFADVEKKQEIEEFEKLKQELQIMNVQNEGVNEEEKKQKLAKMYNVLIQNQDVKEYFDLEIAFNQLMVDVNKIIGSAVKDII